jgi:hypothetical protein
MRYRLMASYRGVPYEAGVGPSDVDVVLFAACPPPEELGFEPATGHWRKHLVRSEVDAVWQSRPVGIYRGEPCIVLDDLGDRLHIAYIGRDANRASRLGYWQVDRGVFELLALREEVIDLTEERVESAPHETPHPAQAANDPAAGEHTGALAPASAATGNAPPEDDTLVTPGSPADDLQSGPRARVLDRARAGAGAKARWAAPASAPGDPEPGSDTEPHARKAVPGVPADLPQAGQGSLRAARMDADSLADSRPAAPAFPANAPRPSPDTPPSSPGTPQAGSGRLEDPLRDSPAQASQATPTSPFAAPQAGPGRLGDPLRDSPTQASQATPTSPFAAPQTGPGDPLRAHSADGLQAIPLTPAGTPPEPDRLGDVTLRAGSPAEETTPLAQPNGIEPGTASQANVIPTAPEPSAGAQATGLPVRDGTTATSASSDGLNSIPAQRPSLDTSPLGHDPREGSAHTRRRAARRQRVSTRDIFSGLTDLAAIPRAAYALEAEVDGALCLLATADGFEVFVAADGARHEVRSFSDEEAAYFYLFGVLAAEAVRNGSLAPVRTIDAPQEAG